MSSESMKNLARSLVGMDRPRVDDVWRRLEEFLGREMALAIHPDAEARFRVESMDQHYDDYGYMRGPDGMRVTLRLTGYIARRRRPEPYERTPEGGALVPESVAADLRRRLCSKGPESGCKCGVCRHDLEVTARRAKRAEMFSDEGERRRYGRDLERAQASASKAAPAAKRFGPERKEGVAVEDEATLADLLCQEVEP